MEFKVNEDLCIGCGACINLTNETVFKMNDEGFAYADNKEVNNNLEDAKMAVDACPTNAISIIEE